MNCRKANESFSQQRIFLCRTVEENQEERQAQHTPSDMGKSTGRRSKRLEQRFSAGREPRLQVQLHRINVDQEKQHIRVNGLRIWEKFMDKNDVYYQVARRTSKRNQEDSAGVTYPESIVGQVVHNSLWIQHETENSYITDLTIQLFKEENGRNDVNRDFMFNSTNWEDANKRYMKLLRLTETLGTKSIRIQGYLEDAWIEALTLTRSNEPEDLGQVAIKLLEVVAKYSSSNEYLKDSLQHFKAAREIGQRMVSTLRERANFATQGYLIFKKFWTEQYKYMTNLRTGTRKNPPLPQVMLLPFPHLSLAGWFQDVSIRGVRQDGQRRKRSQSESELPDVGGRRKTLRKLPKYPETILVSLQQENRLFTPLKFSPEKYGHERQ